MMTWQLVCTTIVRFESKVSDFTSCYTLLYKYTTHLFTSICLCFQIFSLSQLAQLALLRDTTLTKNTSMVASACGSGEYKGASSEGEM